jgi:hypothetical protein
VRSPAKTSIVLTKAAASLRQIEAAITAFEGEWFDVAITLAGAAEEMTPETTGPALFPVLRDHPRIAAEGVEKRSWVDSLNAERNWLKNAAPPPTMEFHREAAAIMIARAINKGHAAFGIQSKLTENFEAWIKEHIDEIFERQSPAPSV